MEIGGKRVRVQLKQGRKFGFENCDNIEFMERGFVCFRRKDGTSRIVNKDEIIDIYFKGGVMKNDTI